jgi:hypothetical protein
MISARTLWRPGMKENKDKNGIAQHILPTSSNLLGICFALLAFIRLSNISSVTIIDDILGIVITLFLISSIFSYMSIRSVGLSEIYEKIADIIFLVGISSLAIVAMIIIFEMI